MVKVVYCPCGVNIRAETEADLVRLAQLHARTAHSTALTRDQVLAMARPEQAGGQE